MEISTSKLCDDILDVCCTLDETQRGTNWSFEQFFSARSVPRARTLNTLKYLEQEGYLIQSMEPNPHSITVKGELLRELGGFAGQKRRDENERKSQRWTKAATIISAVATFFMMVAICIQAYVMLKGQPTTSMNVQQTPTSQQSTQSQQSADKLHKSK